MDDATRHALVQLLGNAMSDISEDCWCAGWLGGAEHDIPELCRRAGESGRAQRWGLGEITPEQGRALVYLADQLGSWADLDKPGVGFVPYQPFPLTPECLQAIDRQTS